MRDLFHDVAQVALNQLPRLQPRSPGLFEPLVTFEGASGPPAARDAAPLRRPGSIAALAAPVDADRGRAGQVHQRPEPPGRAAASSPMAGPGQAGVGPAWLAETSAPVRPPVAAVPAAFASERAGDVRMPWPAPPGAISGPAARPAATPAIPGPGGPAVPGPDGLVAPMPAAARLGDRHPALPGEARRGAGGIADRVTPSPGPDGRPGPMRAPPDGPGLPGVVAGQPDPNPAAPRPGPMAEPDRHAVPPHTVGVPEAARAPALGAGPDRPPARRAAAAGPTAPPDAAIEITIGRIEIRAEPPPAPARLPARPEPRISLADYKRQWGRAR